MQKVLNFIKRNALPLTTLTITVGIIAYVTRVFNASEIEAFVAAAGVYGPLALIAAKASTIIFAPISGAPLYPIAGALFGFKLGLLYVLIGDFIGHTIAFLIGRVFGRRIVSRFISLDEESLISKIIAKLGTYRGFFYACIAFGTVPEIVSYATGLSTLSYIPFILTIMTLLSITSVLLTGVGSVIGLSVQSLSAVFILPFLGIGMLLLGSWLFMRLLKEDDPPKISY